MRFQALIATATVFLAAPAAQPQIAGGMSAGCTGDSCKATFTISTNAMPTVTGPPYSGRPTMESSRVLADGTHVTSPSPMTGATTYRDSSGRIRTERPLFGGRSPFNLSAVEILDAPAGYVYVLDSTNQVAHRVQVQTRVRPPAGVAPPSILGGPNSTSQSLGTQVMFGVSLVGTRTTSTMPAGSRMGNDRPITTVSETWIDPITNVEVLRTSTSVDGDNKMTMQNYSNAEPDPSLFQIPAGYRIVDEPTGAFTIVMARAN